MVTMADSFMGKTTLIGYPIANCQSWKLIHKREPVFLKMKFQSITTKVYLGPWVSWKVCVNCKLCGHAFMQHSISLWSEYMLFKINDPKHYSR